MSPDIALILGCLGLSSSITYLVHCAFRPLFLVQRLIEIRARLREEMESERRTAREAERAAFRDLSDFVDMFIAVAPLISSLELHLIRRVLARAESAPLHRTGGVVVGMEGSHRRAIGAEAIVSGLSEQAPGPVRDAWMMVITALILHLWAGPGSLILMTVYLLMARFSSDPRRWIVGPLHALLEERRLRPAPH